MDIETAIFNALLHTETARKISSGPEIGSIIWKVPVVCGKCYGISEKNISATDVLFGLIEYKCPDCGLFQHMRPYKETGVFVGVELLDDKNR